MSVGPDLDTLLDLLTQTLDEPEADLRRTVDGLLEALGLAVPSCSGLTVRLAGPRGPVQISVQDNDPDGTRPARSSLWVRLGPTEATELIVRAGAAGAFVDLAADLAWLLGRSIEEIVLDRHLESEADDVHSLAAATEIDQALGVLLAGGLTPEEAERRLEDLATLFGVEKQGAAQRILAGLDGRDGVGPTPLR